MTESTRLGGYAEDVPASAQSPDSRTAGNGADDRSVGDLFGEIAKDISTLMRQEVELAKAEFRHEAGKAGKAGAMLGGSGVAGLLVAVFLSLAAMFALDAAMPTGWAALIVAALWAIVGAVLYFSGRKRLRDVNAVPERTVETLKEDAKWVRNQTK